MPVGERRNGDGEEDGDGGRLDRRRLGRGRRGRGKGGPRVEEEEGESKGGIKVSCYLLFTLWITIVLHSKAGPTFSPALVI